MKKVTVSAPGKLHLSGEHAVVYGKPAVLVSTSKRMNVTLEQNQKSILRQAQDKNQNDIVKIRNKDRYIDNIIKIIEKKHKIDVKGVDLTIDSDIPIGVGMGSSAALAVVLIGALLTWFGKPWNTQEINELAYQAEKFKHGNPSGGDNTIVTNGGILWYRKELDFLKTFWLLPFKISKSFAPFVLINTGREETAGELVGLVKKQQEKNEREFTWLLTRIEKVTRQMVNAIHDEKEVEMRRCIRENEALLEEMGVVSGSTQKLICEIEKKGGVGKISGAGGVKKGSGIILTSHNDPQALLSIANKHKLDAFQVQLGGEGVRLEQAIV